MPVLPTTTAAIGQAKTGSHKSQTVTMGPLTSCLLKAEEMLGKDRVWRAINELQSSFLLKFFNDIARGDIAKIPELEAIASFKVDEVNTFMKDRGFPIELAPLQRGDFAVASVLNVLVEWLVAGEVTSVHRGRYPAVKLGKRNMLRYYTSPSNSHPIVQIPTKSGDWVYMTVVGHPPAGFGLVELAQELNRTSLPNDQFGDVIFPMADYDRKIDISWLVGLATTDTQGDDWEITEALQQTRFRMNQLGARAQSAAAMSFMKMGMAEQKPDLVIDQPFLIWITRDGLSQPLLTGFMAEDCWKNPGNLS